MRPGENWLCLVFIINENTNQVSRTCGCPGRLSAPGQRLTETRNSRGVEKKAKKRDLGLKTGKTDEKYMRSL